MSDCAKVEMRELLPELVHDQLDAATHARVTAHLAACSECRAELELLQTARQALRPIMPLDKRAIVAALPLPGNRQAARPLASRRGWQIAAAITVLVLGGVSFNTVRWVGGPEMALVDSARNSGDTGAARAESVLAIADTPVASPDRVSAAGVVIDLADEDLETLIGELDKLEAAPRADPDANRFGRMVAGITGGD